MKPLPDVDMYFVFSEGFVLGSATSSVEEYYAGSDRENRAQAIRAIVSGQVQDVTNVMCCNPVDHTCCDVTEDIARECLTLAQEVYFGDELPSSLRAFLETALGIEAVASEIAGAA